MGGRPTQTGGVPTPRPVADPEPPGRDAGSRRRGRAEEAQEEILADLRSGDFTLYGDFNPYRLAAYYLQRHAAAEGGGGSRPANARIEELIDKLVDRVLVSRDSPLNAARVHMRFAAGPLAGTEVHLCRDRGSLQVDFRAGSEEGHGFLSGHRQGLGQRLCDRLGEPVQVRVSRGPDT